MAEGERRLVAIMFTDMAGYTALTQRNESLALRAIDSQAVLLRPLFVKFHGKEVKTIGDSFLVEFESALEAVKCALEIQKLAHEHKSLSAEAEEIAFLLPVRIGIHLGDVIHKANDVFGDAVNIASRIEPLAEPGGICLSDQVYGQVRNKISDPIKKLEPKVLKNVNFPIDIYKIVMPWENLTSSSPQDTNFRTSRVAVLPFANISPDPNDDYFAEGLTEELIDRLSQVRELEVIARTSIMNYKDTQKNVSEIAKELKVGSVIEGSVRKAGNRIRVTTQLINSNSEAHLWSMRYDRNLDDIFAVQTDIAENVVNSLKVSILAVEKNAIRYGGPNNPEAYVEYLRGLYFWHRELSESNFRKSAEHFEKALELEADYPEALASLGVTTNNLAYFGYDPMDETYAKAKELISKALELGDLVPEAHFASGVQSFYIDGDWAKAESEFRRAVELNPGYLDAITHLATFLSSVGYTEESIAQIEKALHLDPVSYNVHSIAAGIYQLAKRDQKALDEHKKAIELEPEADHTNYGITLINIGRIQEGVSEIEKAMATGRSSFFKGNLACAYAIAGRREDAFKLVEELKSEKNRAPASYSIACAYACLGEKKEALDWLERAYKEHTIFGFPLFNIEPFLANVRDEPRFKELIRKSGLDKFPSARNNSQR